GLIPPLPLLPLASGGNGLGSILLGLAFWKNWSLVFLDGKGFCPLSSWDFSTSWYSSYVCDEIVLLVWPCQPWWRSIREV
ncbi:unnamed protein product, partial [Prunus brigantina]